MGNTSLGAAKKAKNDEFYTQWADIEREMNAYLEYDPDIFRGKTLLLPCDDPEWSNFTKFFALHFEEYGLKKLISTSYAPMANQAAAFYEPTLFETEGPDYDEDKSLYRGRVFTLVPEDLDGDGKINIDDLRWEYLEGDGDFRSAEVTTMLDEADMVITNPPFSLFREFLSWLMEGDVLFSVIGNTNAITYKEVFPLIRDNRIWLGATGNSNDFVFAVPAGTDVKKNDKLKAEKLGYVGDFTRLGNACWFTNVQHGRRHEPLQLMTMEDNRRFGPKSIVESGFPKYENYDAIEVSKTIAIPSDFEGVMGVPISFLDKYNPDQFEILGITDRQNEHGLKTREFTKEDSPLYNDLNRRAAIRDPDGSLRSTYARIFIRHKNPEVTP